MSFQVIGWNDYFEGAKSKTYNNKTSCQMPTKHGLGFRRLIKEKDGPALFGAWCALIQVLSRHHRPRNGYCTCDGTENGIPLSYDDLSLLTTISPDVFARLFKVASSPDVRWLATTGDTTVPWQDTMVPLHSNSDSDLDSNSCRGDNTPLNPPVKVDDKRKKDEAFEHFWSSYPRKQSKKKARESFAKHVTLESLSTIMAALEKQKASRDWTKDGGQFIPHASTWLNQHRWEDEVAPSQIQQSRPIVRY